MFESQNLFVREDFIGRGDQALVGAEAKRERTGDHIAFRVAPETIPSIADKLKSKGCEFILSDSGTALYFFDFDNHVFELNSSDEEQELNRLAASSGGYLLPRCMFRHLFVDKIHQGQCCCG